jgi:molybdate/tungstate transport system permease protein
VNSFRYRQVSAFSHLLVFIPLSIVFLLFGRYAIAAAILAAGILAARLAGKPRRRKNDRPLIVFSILGGILILFIVLPILNLLFTTEPSRILAMARDSSVESALFLTLGAAGVATLISLVFGIPLGYVLAREQFAGKAAVEGIVDMPVVIPHTIAGIALLFIFGRAGIVGAPLNASFNVILSDSFWGIVLAMVFVGMPFVVNHARDGFLKVDPRALLSGAIMTWARAISEFGSVAVIAYYPRTINTLLFEWYNFFGYTYTKPLAALLLLVALTIFVALRAVPRLTRAEHDQT